MIGINWDPIGHLGPLPINWYGLGWVAAYLVALGQRYVPALGFRWLDWLYDPLMRLSMPEREFKNALVDQAGIEKHHRVLDVGCGTGTLVLLLQERYPLACAVGVDGDDRIIRIAAAKASRAGTTLALTLGLATALPYGSCTFDRVLTTLVLHHLDLDAKQRTLREIFRVLAPGGELHIADWGRPHHWLMRLASLSVRIFDGLGTTRDNLGGRLPALCAEAGFVEVVEQRRLATLFGTLAFYTARKAR